jgi:hypothetical protein
MIAGAAERANSDRAAALEDRRRHTARALARNFRSWPPTGRLLLIRRILNALTPSATCW